MKPTRFEGIFTPIITPFQQDGTADKDAFAEMIEYLIAAGVHCIAVGGSTGEYYAQTIEERIDMMSYAREVIGKRVSLMAGVGAVRTEDSVVLATAAKRVKADSILLNLPSYAAPTDEENAVHVLKINDAAGLPIMLYNNPGRTGANMGEIFFERVHKVTNFNGIKESSGDINLVHLIALKYPQLNLCCGMDNMALEFFAWGAKSWICAGSNFLPAEHIALYSACVVEGDFDKGRKVMSALMPLMDYLEEGGKFVQSVKYGCELAGLKSGQARRPLLPLNQEEKDNLKQIIATLKQQIVAG